MLGDAGLPLGGAGGVDAGAERVDGDGDGHVCHLKFINRFHAEVGEGEDAGGVDGLGDEVGRAADGDEVDGVEFADGGDGFWPALGLADHAEQAGLGEDLAGEFVHAGGGGGAGGVLLKQRRYSPEEARKAYVFWLNSSPFDCGGTVSAGLRGKPNLESQANGALMRISPLGVFGCNYDLERVPFNLVNASAPGSKPGGLCGTNCTRKRSKQAAPLPS